jgi:ribosomal protein S18 acetylase RimI-like enzyme
MIDVIVVHTKEEYEAAAKLFQAYAAWLNIDLSFQNFNEELLQLQKMYIHPEGAILLAKLNNDFVGCVAVRKKEEHIAELKRMYIKPVYQKQGIASLLLEKSLDIATALGYKKIRLDTLANMLPAISLYKKYGFYEIEPYYFNPEKNAVFFERLL